MKSKYELARSTVGEKRTNMNVTFREYGEKRTNMNVENVPDGSVMKQLS